MLRSVDFSVTGSSLPFVMMQKIDPYKRMIGMSFPDRASLEAFIADRRQVLLNERVIASVTTSYEATPAAAGGFDVALHFQTVDTINIVVLPYPKFNTNTGGDLGLRGRDYNFFGSMQPLELNLDYFLDTELKSAIGVHMTFETPFQLFGQAWSLGVSEDARFPIGNDDRPASVTEVGFSFDIPGPGFSATVTASQGYSYNANGIDPTLPDDSDEWFLTESLKATATIPISPNWGNLGPLKFIPTLSYALNWRPGVALSYYGREGSTIAFSGTLSFGRVDWVYNLKQGLSVSLSNDYSYAFTYNDFIGDLSLVVDGYTPLAQWIGLAAQLTVRDRFAYASAEDIIINLGSNMRGIADARIQAFQAIFVNLSVPVKLFDFPGHLIIKKDWLDFGLQAQPFVDVGFLPGRDDWLWCSGGAELLVYPAAFRSFIFRVSIGWDLMDLDRAYELSFGMGLMY